MQTEDYESLHALESDFWWFSGMREITSALLDPLLPAGKRMILDAGCGTGGNLQWLKPYAGNGEVVGIDLVADALRFCKQRGSEPLIQASVTNLPFGDETFDLVTSFDVLVQLPGKNSDDLALGEMYRVLRPGGYVLVRAAAYEWMRSSHDEALGTQRRYTISSLAQKLERAGFQLLRTTYANSALLPIAALNRLVLKRIGLSPRGSDVKPLAPSLRWLDPVFKAMLSGEARWLSREASSLPAGLSAICIGIKPQDSC